MVQEALSAPERGPEGQVWGAAAIVSGPYGQMQPRARAKRFAPARQRPAVPRCSHAVPSVFPRCSLGGHWWTCGTCARARRCAIPGFEPGTGCQKRQPCYTLRHPGAAAMSIGAACSIYRSCNCPGYLRKCGVGSSVYLPFYYWLLIAGYN